MSLTRPLTRPLTRALSHSELTQKLGGGFSIFALNPFLLFDARDSMVGTLENPTLDLNPALPETLDVITATRAGTATFTNANGNIASASPNTVRVDQTQGAELTPTVYQRVNYTDFSQGWGNVNSTFVDGSGFSGNSSKILTGTSSSGAVDTAVITADGVTYTGSIYIRRVNGTGNLEFAIYGSASSDVTPLFTESVSTDWIRVDLQFLGKSGGGNVYFGVKIQQSGDSVEIAMPQVEEGTTASDFVANTTGSPKFITGATFGPRVPMILVEPTATNLVTHSEDFSNSYWTKSGSSVVSGQTSPSGDTSAFKLVEDTSSGEHKVSTGIITVSAGTTDTYSVFVKKAGRTKIAIREEQHGGKYVSFNLLSKTVISNTGLTANIIELSDDWLRIDYSQNSGGGLEKFSLFLLDDAYTSGSPTSHSYTGDDTSGVYIWGAQLETGSVATSYIPTSGSPVTRAADNLVISGSAFSDFFNSSEGTFYVEGVDRQATGSSHSYIVGQSTSQFFMYKNDSNALIANFDGTNILSLGPIVGNQLFRAAVSYNSSVKSLSFNGATSSGNHRATGGFSATNIIKIGSGYTNVFSGHYRRIIYWPYHSDNL